MADTKRRTRRRVEPGPQGHKTKANDGRQRTRWAQVPTALLAESLCWLCDDVTSVARALAACRGWQLTGTAEATVFRAVYKQAWWRLEYGRAGVADMPWRERCRVALGMVANWRHLGGSRARVGAIALPVGEVATGMYVDGPLLVVALSSGAVASFSLLTGAPLARWQAHATEVLALNLDTNHSSTRRLLTVSSSAARLWRVTLDCTPAASGGPSGSRSVVPELTVLAPAGKQWDGPPIGVRGDRLLLTDSDTALHVIDATSGQSLAVVGMPPGEALSIAWLTASGDVLFRTHTARNQLHHWLFRLQEGKRTEVPHSSGRLSGTSFQEGDQAHAIHGNGRWTLTAPRWIHLTTRGPRFVGYSYGAPEQLEIVDVTEREPQRRPLLAVRAGSFIDQVKTNDRFLVVAVRDDREQQRCALHVCDFDPTPRGRSRVPGEIWTHDPAHFRSKRRNGTVAPTRTTRAHTAPVSAHTRSRSFPSSQAPRSSN